MTLKIIADENIPLLDEFFSPIGSVKKISGRSVTREQLIDADVLLVRSVTAVNEALLTGTRIGFVGTATIGTDHLDTAWLDAQGIRWASAPGSNATSVVEYVLSALCEVEDVLERLLDGGVVGIIGGGNVGSRLCHRLQALGIKVNIFDPFLTSSSGLPLVGWEQVLSADVLCLHTPLTRSGEHPTYHLLNTHGFEKIADNTLILNAGRGAVVDNVALFDWLSANKNRRAVLDVWENEPAISAQLFQQVALGTPHIAGYSLDGKWAGSRQLFSALTAWLQEKNLHSSLVVDSVEKPFEVLEIDDVINHQLKSKAELIRELMRAVYPIRQDHQALADVMQSADINDRREGFDRLRRQYPVRREIAAHRIANQASLSAATREVLVALGFIC
jgi:erythronate-4-phosphate dehydrogenase